MTLHTPTNRVIIHTFLHSAYTETDEPITLVYSNRTVTYNMYSNKTVYNL